ncbi:uncharacterized protein LOC119688093 [Teleopsis dalmanni]|uniref:uncharacterized protein LOC119688093 n=1 Tax=Teleopsis dalmanni TaxID=139649 RepID=UPI0018CF51FE|nr:uncharacterized protein LOC119688093 [Teleopsis dalmanni]
MEKSIEFLCRLCAVNTNITALNESVNIFKTPLLKERIEKFFYVTLSENDPLPKNVCKKCFRQVVSTAALSKIANQTEGVFLDYVNNTLKEKTTIANEVSTTPEFSPLAAVVSKESAEIDLSAHVSPQKVLSISPTNAPTTSNNKQTLYAPKSIAQRAFQATAKGDGTTKNRAPGVLQFLNGEPKKLPVLQSRPTPMPTDLRKNVKNTIEATLAYQQQQCKKIMSNNIKHTNTGQISLLKSSQKQYKPVEKTIIPENTENVRNDEAVKQTNLNTEKTAISEDLLLGDVIKDPDLLRLILTALKWPISEKYIEHQMIRLKQSPFQTIMSDPNLLNDTDLTKILGSMRQQLPFNSNTNAINLYSHDLIVTPPKILTPMKDVRSKVEVTNPLPYKLPPETSVQLIPASPEADDEEKQILNVPITHTRKPTTPKKLRKCATPKRRNSSIVISDEELTQTPLMKNVIHFKDYELVSIKPSRRNRSKSVYIETPIISDLPFDDVVLVEPQPFVVETTNSSTNSIVTEMPALNLSAPIVKRRPTIKYAGNEKPKSTKTSCSSTRSVSFAGTITTKFFTTSPNENETKNLNDLKATSSTSAAVIEVDRGSTLISSPGITTTTTTTATTTTPTMTLNNNTNAAQNIEPMVVDVPNETASREVLIAELGANAVNDANRQLTRKALLGQHLMQAIGLRTVNEDAVRPDGRIGADPIRQLRTALKKSLKEAQSPSRAKNNEVGLEVKPAEKNVKNTTTNVNNNEETIGSVTSVLQSDNNAVEPKTITARRRSIAIPRERNLLQDKQNTSESKVETKQEMKMNINMEKDNKHVTLLQEVDNSVSTEKLNEAKEMIEIQAIPRKRGRKSKLEKAAAEKLAAENAQAAAESLAMETDENEVKLSMIDSDGEEYSATISENVKTNSNRPTRASKIQSKYYIDPVKRSRTPYNRNTRSTRRN